MTPVSPWKQMLGVAVILIVGGTVAALLDGVLLPVLAPAGIVPTAYLAGRLWWQEGIDGGLRRPAGRPNAWKAARFYVAAAAVLTVVMVYAVGGILVGLALLADGYLSFLAGLTYVQHELRSSGERRA